MRGVASFEQFPVYSSGYTWRVRGFRNAGCAPTKREASEGTFPDAVTTYMLRAFFWRLRADREQAKAVLAELEGRCKCNF